MTASDLTEDELTCLRWCADCNGKGIGFLGPTVWKHGPVPEYASAVNKGLVGCVELRGVKNGRQASGYWITSKGRQTLRQAMEGPRG